MRIETASVPVEEDKSEIIQPEISPQFTAQEVVDEEPSPRVRLGQPTDAFSRETLENEAPVGSDENPIVQYGKQ